MKKESYYTAAIDDLADALTRIRLVNREFPQLRIPTRPLQHKIAALKMLREKHYG